MNKNILLKEGKPLFLLETRKIKSIEVICSLYLPSFVIINGGVILMCFLSMPTLPSVTVPRSHITMRNRAYDIFRFVCIIFKRVYAFR